MFEKKLTIWSQKTLMCVSYLVHEGIKFFAMSFWVQPFFFCNPCSPALTCGSVRSNGLRIPVVKVKTIQGSSQYGVLWIGTILDKFCLNFAEKRGLPSVVIINKKTEASRKLLNKKFGLTSQYFSIRRNCVNSVQHQASS